MLDKILQKFDALMFSMYLMAVGIVGALAIKIYQLCKCFLNWAGKELFRSAIKETRDILVNPVLKDIKEDLNSKHERINNDIKDVKEDIKSLKGNFKRYQAEKHDLEGEHGHVVQVILNDDHESREMLKAHYEGRKEVK